MILEPGADELPARFYGAWERSLLTIEDSLARSRADTATSLVAVYKALGGGWIAPRTGG